MMDRLRGPTRTRAERRRREERVALLRAARGPVPAPADAAPVQPAPAAPIGGERSLPPAGQLPRRSGSHGDGAPAGTPALGTRDADNPSHDPSHNPWQEPWDPDRPSLHRRLGGALAGLVNVLILVVVVGGIGFAVGGFLRFIDEVNEHSPATVAQVGEADGIVVLTGGPRRLAAAGELLAAGRAEQLLVSGVNLRATEPQVRSLLDVRQATFACCVELGFEARDTIGNARETAGWFARLTDEANGVLAGITAPRLIVVTSNYHMPRAMHELGLALPEVRLVPYPVRGVNLEADRWWRDASAWRLLVGEYGKLILARAREYPLLSGMLARIVSPAPANG